MAVNDGEERLITVFADVHYYFDAPSPRPLSHRFDKGSYLYLYGNQSGSGSRLEIANNVGKAEQDAFTGALDPCTICQSHKHPTLCTITVDGYRGQRRELGRRPEHHWKLPSGDPRNERPLLLHLHTVDIYFWTAQDADSFIGSVSRLLQQDQVHILDVAPIPAAHDKVMSPVVRQLETVAVQDPAYHLGRAQFPPDTPTTAEGVEKTRSADSSTFQPLAYNPAAPAAPEPIRHREKTPPPVDAEAGTGLAAAAYNDEMHSQNPLSRPSYARMSSTQAYVGSPAQSHPSPYTSPAPGLRPYHSPIPSTTGQRSSSVSSLQPAPAQSIGSSMDPQSPLTVGSPSSQQLVPAFSPPPQDAGVPLYDKDGIPLNSPSGQIIGSSYVGGVHQPLQHVQPQYADYLGSTGHQSPGPVGGYSNYTYTQQHQQQQQGHDNEYDIHSQVYRPTEEEAKKDKRHRPSDAGPGQQSGKFEQQASRVDKGVNRLFKKLEKKIG